MTSATPVEVSDRPARPSRSGSFRPDIEGLRAVAVGAVLLYHAGLSWFGGGYVGVDVFFVISGFLITGLLLRELERDGRVSLRDFYARRAKRLLPSLAVVLLTVSVLAWFLAPPVRRAGIYGDVIAAALYVVNWWFAHNAVDYSAAGAQTSPVQHIWSLAVEEQFYLVWPLLMLAATTWWRFRRHRHPRRAPQVGLRAPLLAVLTAVSIASFVYCLQLTSAEAGRAYFSTLARAWELGLGGLLAVLVTRRSRLRVPARPLLALAGLAAVAVAVVSYDDDTTFPGAWALLPTLGAAAVILAGSDNRVHAGAQQVLASAPMRHVGRLSYTWYLWHWPLLVFAEARWGSLTPGVATLVVVASYLPTLATHRLVEERFRRSVTLTRRPVRALRLGLVCTVAVALVAVGLRSATPVVPTASRHEAVGAKALTRGTGVQTSASRVRPAPQHADQDRGRMYDDGCLVHKRDTVSGRCVYGDAASPTTVVLFGDSHAMQWFPALVQVAQRRHWRLVGLTKAGCPVSTADIFDPDLKRAYTECTRWHRRTLARIDKLHPDLVVASSLTRYRVLGNDGKKLDSADSLARLKAGFGPVLRRLDRDTGRLVVIGDVPHHRDDVPDCVADHLHDLGACAIPESEAVTARPLADVAASLPGVHVVDPAEQLCPQHTCPGVIGNVLMYRNAGHLTATYAHTLDEWLGKQLPRHPNEAASGR